MHVVIIGGGFAGLAALRPLLKAKKNDLCVTLIDAQDHFLFTPRLIDALAKPTLASHIQAALPALGVRLGFQFIQASVERIQREGRRVEYTVSDGRLESINYDVLVLCPGSRVNFYQTPGAEAHALPLKTSHDVERIHNHLRTCFRQAEHASDDDRRRLLACAVIGAGPSGVESVFALQRCVADQLKKDPFGLLTHASFRLIQGDPQILPGFRLRLIRGTENELKKRGIALELSTNVIGIAPGQVLTSCTPPIAASTIVWTAGIQPNSIPMEPTVRTDVNQALPVDGFLRVAPHIFGAGDGVHYTESNMTVPRNAQTAMRMGAHIAKNILHQLSGQSLVPFHYRAKGNLLVLDDTGFIDAGFFSLQSRFTPFIRDTFYAWRMRQLTG